MLQSVVVADTCTEQSTRDWTFCDKLTYAATYEVSENTWPQTGVSKWLALLDFYYKSHSRIFNIITNYLKTRKLWCHTFSSVLLWGNYLKNNKCNLLIIRSWSLIVVNVVTCNKFDFHLSKIIIRQYEIDRKLARNTMLFEILYVIIVIISSFQCG